MGATYHRLVGRPRSCGGLQGNTVEAAQLLFAVLCQPALPSSLQGVALLQVSIILVAV